MKIIKYLSLALVASFLVACGGSSDKKNDDKDSIVSADAKTMVLSLRSMTTGNELWTTDGTEQGTQIIKDINKVNNDAKIDEMVEMNGILYFRGYSATYGEELWRSDGTKEGTHVVKDIWKGSTRSFPRYLTVINNTLYFTASDIKHGKRLWKSDGTKEGTVMIDKEFALSYNDAPSHILHLTKVDDTLFFSADDGVHGMELWKSDGTVDGTVMVKDIKEGKKGHWQDMSHFNGDSGRLYFVVRKSNKHYVLWTSDGTEAGTHIVSGFADEGYLSFYGTKKIAGVVYANTDNYENYKHVQTLWKIDEHGATELLHTNVISRFSILNGKAYFFVREEISEPYTLWKSDGTVEGTKQVFTQQFSHPSFPNLNDPYFVEYIERDKSAGIERHWSLWKMDNEENLIKIKESVPEGGMTGFINLGGKIIFTGNDSKQGKELWETDGTVNGTKILKDIKPGFKGSNPSKLIQINNTVYFLAQSETYSNQLWKTDGTETGTVKVDGIDSGTADARPSKFVQIKDTYYFIATDGVNGRELWKSDGTEAGTQMVKDITKQNYSNNAYGTLNLCAINNTLYFNTYNVKSKILQLWKSDGTEAGTVKLKDFKTDYWKYSHTDYSRIKYFDINGTILFQGYDSEHGIELWTTDGTEEGTKLFKDIAQDANSSLSRTREFVEINDVLYFKAEDPINGKSLWRSDGTKEGTKVILPFPKDYYAYNYAVHSGYGPNNLTDVNGTLFFTMNVDDNYTELWKSDGSKIGTKVVKRFKKLDYQKLPYGLTNINGILYFIPVYEDGKGWELWKSDGTTKGTTLVTKVGKSLSYHRMSKVTYFKDKIYFSLPDNVLGRELWVSNGTQEGTKLFKDFRKGKESSNPKIRGVLNGHLLFEATDNKGRKLWKTDGTVEGTKIVKDGFR